jgi:AraC-like DNA-binding protein
MSTDTLSDVLRVVRLSGAAFFSLDCRAPWVTETPAGKVVGAYLLPDAEHIIDYHAVTSGSCWGGPLGEPAIELGAGDFIVFPHGDSHVISSAPGMRARPAYEAYEAASSGPLPVSFTVDGAGVERARLVCGFLGCDARPFNPLLAALPRVIHLRAGSGHDAMMQQLIELAVTETAAPSAGGRCTLSMLSELLFVEAVRRYVAALPPDAVNWFAGLKDDNIGRALQRLHEAPAHDWNLQALAKAAGVSRSTLAERFTQLVGVPPMQYLAKWRIQLAASQLRAGQAGLAEIAERIGYGSEAALCRAFKREVGVTPASYRRRDQHKRACAQ